MFEYTFTVTVKGKKEEYYVNSDSKEKARDILETSLRDKYGTYTVR